MAATTCAPSPTAAATRLTDFTLKDDETKEETPTGLPLPYKVVLDKESRQILMSCGAFAFPSCGVAL
jgi:hypothetical protein